MKTMRPIAIAVVLPFVVFGVAQDLAQAALFDDQISPLDLIVYLLIGLALIIGIVAIFSGDFLTRILGRLGDSSGEERGPKPGDGAVIHHSSGEADFDGSAGNTPPDTKRELPHPPNKSAD